MRIRILKSLLSQRDQFNGRILLDLIYLTPMDVGIDFNSLRRTKRLQPV
jgi:hypothetical protein